MNWSAVLALRRRHLRRAAGDGGARSRSSSSRRSSASGSSAGTGCRRGCTSPIWLGRDRDDCSRAYFILAANSWMQHPVGYRDQPDDRPRRADVDLDGADQLDAARARSRTRSPRPFMTARRCSCVGVARLAPRATRRTSTMLRAAVRLGAVAVLVAGVGVVVIGHVQGQLMTEQQPMKMAAAEALYETAAPAPFSLFAFGALEHGTASDARRHRDPHGSRSSPPTRSNGTVEGINDLAGAPTQARVRARATTRRSSRVTYWSFRLMIGFGVARAPDRGARAVAAGAGGSRPSRRFLRVAIVAAVALPFAREHARLDLHRDGPPAVGRVQGLLTTRDGVSPSVGTARSAHARSCFTLLYGLLAVVDGVAAWSATRAGGAGPPATAGPDVDRARRRPTMPLDLRLLRATPWHCTDVWFVPDRGPLDRLLRARGLRLRRRHAAAAPRRDEHRRGAC